MRIAYVLPHSLLIGEGVTGDVIQQKSVIEHLEKNGHWVDVLCYEGLASILRISRVESTLLQSENTLSKVILFIGKLVWFFQRITGIPYLNFFNNIQRCNTVLSVLDEYDVVYERFSLYRTGIALACRLKRKRYILFFDADPLFELDFCGNPIKGILRWRAEQMMKFCFRVAKKIICVSSVVSHQVQKVYGVNSEKFLVMPNAVDSDFFCPADAKDLPKIEDLEGKSVILFVGSFCVWHDVLSLVHAFDLVLKQVPNVVLLMVGDGDLRATCEKTVADLGLQGKVLFTGAVSRQKVLYYIRAADIAVAPYPSMKQEFWGSPMKVFEYMACGKPVVVSRAGQLAEIIQDGQNGVLAEAGSVEPLSEQILRLLKDDALRSSLGVAARKDVLLKYSWPVYVQKLEEILKNE